MTTRLMVDTNVLAALRDERSRHTEQLERAEAVIRELVAVRPRPVLELMQQVVEQTGIEPSAVRLAIRRLVDGAEVMVTLSGEVRTLSEPSVVPGH